MKKLLLFSVVIGGVVFASCSKKECECTYNGTTITISEDEAEELGFEGDFEEACKSDTDCKVV